MLRSACQIHVKIRKRTSKCRNITITLFWSAFVPLSYVFRNPGIPTCQKRKVYNIYAPPVAAYVLTKRKLRMFQKYTDRRMLEFYLRQKKQKRRNTPININIIQQLTQHVARQNTVRWTERLPNWRSKKNKRSVGRSKKRKIDIKGYMGERWYHIAQDRGLWKRKRERRDLRLAILRIDTTEF